MWFVVYVATQICIGIYEHKRLSVFRITVCLIYTNLAECSHYQHYQILAQSLIADTGLNPFV